jgi:hypothetical protein
MVSETPIKNRRNYYRVLQVQPDAPAEIIHASYRAIMKTMKIHPDLGGSSSEASLINEAYQVLGDPESRALYDAELFKKYSKKILTSEKPPIAPILCPICRRPLFRNPNPGETCPTCLTPLRSQSAPELKKNEHRAVERIKMEKVVFYLSWPGEKSEGRIADFSPKGIKVYCEENVAPETVLKLSCDFFEASGSVIYCREEAENAKRIYALGIGFIAVNFSNPIGSLFSSSG